MCENQVDLMGITRVISVRPNPVGSTSNSLQEHLETVRPYAPKNDVLGSKMGIFTQNFDPDFWGKNVVRLNEEKLVSLTTPSQTFKKKLGKTPLFVELAGNTPLREGICQGGNDF